MTDSRSLEDLHPTVRDMAERLIEQARVSGVPLTITCTLRTLETQANLYAQGRSKPGKIVTRARPGYSFHNFGLALDVVPTELLKMPNWGDTPRHQARANELWSMVGAIGKAIGFCWGGDFVRLKDRPHFEWSSDHTLAQLRAGLRPAAAMLIKRSNQRSM